jgi:tetratricopeptide (TPR) repeat protein
MVAYTSGWLWSKVGNGEEALREYNRAATLASDYCFPSRLEEIGVLNAAMRANPKDARAPYYLGNLLFDRRRRQEAIKLWEMSARIDPGFSIVWRNLGIGYFNHRRAPVRARRAYDHAFQANPGDARLLFERDQLWKRLGESPGKRLSELEKRLDLVAQRDDLSLELAALYNQVGEPGKALGLVSTRRFQPWEGGEGGPLGQHTRSHIALGRRALAEADAAKAREHFAAALDAPRNLGEARHLLANQSEGHYWLGCALDALGDKEQARKHWLVAASSKGDFQAMTVRAFSEMSCYRALSLERLGRKRSARDLFRELLAYSRQLERSEAKLDYFATSLPTMLLFDDDLRARQVTNAWFLRAQALFGLGRRGEARRLLRAVLDRDPNHAPAADFLRWFPTLPMDLFLVAASRQSTAIGRNLQRRPAEAPPPTVQSSKRKARFRGILPQNHDHNAHANNV